MHFFSLEFSHILLHLILKEGITADKHNRPRSNRLATNSSFDVTSSESFSLLCYCPSGVSEWSICLHLSRCFLGYQTNYWELLRIFFKRPHHQPLSLLAYLWMDHCTHWLGNPFVVGQRESELNEVLHLTPGEEEKLSIYVFDWNKQTNCYTTSVSSMGILIYGLQQRSFSSLGGN